MTDPSPATAKQAARKPSRARAERVLPTDARRLRVSDISRPPRWLCNVRPHSSRRIFGSRLASTLGPLWLPPSAALVREASTTYGNLSSRVASRSGRIAVFEFPIHLSAWNRYSRKYEQSRIAQATAKNHSNECCACQPRLAK